jgi:UDP-glucose 4-epimerase
MPYNSNMTSLITGGMGFIGFNLAKSLQAKGECVIILDNLSRNDYPDLNPGISSSKISFIKGDILDRDFVSKYLAGITHCYHLAAALGVEKINNNSIDSLEINLKGSQIVLDAAVNVGARTLLASSSEIYGKNPNMPLREDSDRVLGSPEVTRWSYSEAKAMDELHAFELYKHKLFPVTIARFFNTVGPRQSGSYGMVLPRFVKAAISNQPLTVYGDGTQSRTFCSVTDVVDALVLLMDSKESIGQAYNIGSTNEITITELAQKVIKLTNSTSEIIYKKHSEVFGDRFEEPQRRVPDISKIKKVVGWQPKQSLDEVIIEIAEYLKD